MNDIAIRVDNLSKRYRIGEHQRHDTLRDAIAGVLSRGNSRQEKKQTAEEHIWALKDVSFEVKQGEIVGVIGRNGAGKSTLLKILSRITEPTRGRVEMIGRVGSLLEVGTGFHPELTGRENVYLSGAILGMQRTEIERKFDEIVDFSGVERFIDTPIKRYSSGMNVRLGFAVAAHLEPEILLVDEVLAVGDAAFQKKSIGKMDSVASQGRTVLFVSHNIPLISNICGRSILLKSGDLHAQGATQSVVSEYLSEISSSSLIDIGQRIDRKGNGNVRINHVDLLDGNCRPSNGILSGSQVVIRIHYQTRDQRVLTNCRISAAVFKYRQPYFVLSTELTDTSQLDISGRGYIDFVIPDLPLSAGTYDLDLYIDSNGEVEDWIHSAAQLNVGEGDFYGTGKLFPLGWHPQGFLVRHHWRHSGVLTEKEDK